MSDVAVAPHCPVRLMRAFTHSRPGHQRGWSQAGSLLACSRQQQSTRRASESTIFTCRAQVQSLQAGRTATGYKVTREQYRLFHEQGFVHLEGLLSENELQRFIDPVYEQFMAGRIEVSGNDLCDMSGAEGRTPGQFTVYNIMLPRTYHPAWQGSIFEQRCKDVADQLQGGSMAPDYDQILAKRPHSEDAIFAWHQDMAYWPPTQASTATATCWLAVSEATTENGCMRFVPGTHLEEGLRPHAPVASSRAKSHALCTPLLPTDEVRPVPIRRGDITVHNERIMHGSGPNRSPVWRKAYVLAFRKQACIAEERALGFTHSHNDVTSWDAFHDHK